ncbi:hypothetical protein GH714_014079 [Hevea brasiliensis]|uniref:Uncharacterized protein n=1 Tax=Hevea brasiliensis TaxID=3981 RepID=A0A6A6K695_HEVBR|nr:hypothetical protein GH714_014079 [Hevea brasiliensis]
MDKQGSNNTINFHQSKKTIGSQHFPNSAFGNSAPSKDDFRPTSPGYSPGVGHPKEITTSSVELSVEELKDDYGPTKPAGPNPEVGHTTNLHQSKFGKINSSQPTHSSHVPQSMAEKEEMSSSPVTPIRFGASAADGFRPTTPGSHSPGVGHPLSGEASDVEIDPTPIAAAFEDGFRPTTPGFSPGVGHPKTLVTSSNVENSVTGFSDDYRPTHPGHSPGVGHPYEKNNAEPNP